MMKKKNNNKGFSLVELIVVIAIMAVLVGVLAPQFVKYVEQSKRSTDIANAQSIAEGYLADIADGEIETSVTTASKVVAQGATAGTNEVVAPSSWNGSVATKGSISNGFYVTYDVTAGTCTVYVAGYDVTGSEATTYKTATAAKAQP